MFGMVNWIFAGLLTQYEKKWMDDRERKKWEFWECCEDMREEMGHTVGIQKIHPPRRPARKKHRH